MASHFINKRLLAQLLIFLFFALWISVLVLIHYDPHCKKRISQYLSAHVSQQCKTLISVEFEHFNPFTATLRCSSIHAEMHDWSCDIEKITFSGSWISLIMQGHFNIECLIEGGRGTFELEGSSNSLIKIINDFLAIPSEKPFLVTSIHFKKSDIAFLEKKLGIQANATLTVLMNMQDSQYYIQHVMHRLQAFAGNLEIGTITNGSGDFLSKNAESQGSLYYTLNSPLIPEGNCIVYGVCSPTNSYINLYSSTRTWNIHASYVDNQCTLKGSASLSKMAQHLCPWVPIEADIAFDVQWQNDAGMHGELLGSNLSLYGMKFAPLKCTFTHFQQNSNGRFIFEDTQAYAQGSFLATPTNFKLNITTATSLSVPWFTVDKDLTYSLQSDYQHVQVMLDSAIKPFNALEFVPCALNINAQTSLLDFKAKITDYAMHINKEQKRWSLRGWKEKNEFIKGEGDECSYTLEGTHEVCKIIGDWINVTLAGKGRWQLKGSFKENDIPFEGSFEGQLRVSDYYNLIEKLTFKGIGNIMQRQLYVDACTAQFRTGSFCAKNAYYDFGLDRTYCMVPLQFHNLLVTKHNEFFAQLDGCAYLYGPWDQLTFKGFCIADKSLVTGNILSNELYKDSGDTQFNKDIACDVVVLTKNEVPIKTPLFKTDAQCFLHVTGTTRNPHLLGSIDFNNGSIYFPYDSLFIKKGMLHFNGMNAEPIIELVAKNSIKNYDITLGLHGTVLNPSITLTSSPTITKEQLIALLLGGSDDGSLSLIMPHTMTELFEQLLFGSTATISKTQKYLQSLFEPLKSVRLVPKFSDQTGRGGLRGALEIEVTDRLKASIQQNFSLTEDTRVDISYALSDEANIKITKDERGDVGGEIEMKWRW